MKITPYQKPRNVKIGFVMKRGNAEKEAQSIFKGSIEVQAELQGIDLYKICRVFEKVIKRQKNIK